MFNRREREETEKEGEEEGEQTAVECVWRNVITTCSFSTCANPVHLVLEFFHITFQCDRSAAQSWNGLPTASVVKATEK